MSQLADGAFEQEAETHTVRVVKTRHWRGGDRFYARCSCDAKSARYVNRGVAETMAHAHAALYGGRVEGEASGG